MKEQDESLIKQMVLTTLNKCGACGFQYQLDDIRILGHQQELWFLTILCPQCRSQGFVAAVVKEQSVSPIITDLTPEEREKFTKVSKIEADDVLDIHQFLKDFDGDFQRLLQK